MASDTRLHRIVAVQPYSLLFAAISGAHLYGFGFPSPPRVSCLRRDVRFANGGPSPDSDFDLRGAHVLPLDAVVGLEVCDETVQDSRIIEGQEHVRTEALQADGDFVLQCMSRAGV